MKNLEIVKGIYSAFGRGDIPGLLAAQRADAVWTVAGNTPYSGSYRGAAEILQFFQCLVGAVDMVSFEPERFLDAGSSIVVLGRERVVVKSTGKPADNRWVHVWTLADGKVTAFEEHFDTASVEAAFRK